MSAGPSDSLLLGTFSTASVASGTSWLVLRGDGQVGNMDIDGYACWLAAQTGMDTDVLGHAGADRDGQWTRS